MAHFRLSTVLLGVSNGNHLGDVQALDEVGRDKVGCSNNHIIHMLACKDHEHTLLQTNDRVGVTTVIASHLVVPDAHVEEGTLGLGCLQSFQVTVMEQVPAALDVDDFVGRLRHVFVGEVLDAPRGGKELLHRRLFVDGVEGAFGDGEEFAGDVSGTDTFGPFEYLEAALLLKDLSNFNTLRIITRIITMGIILTIELV